jgi:hypothetical protein
MKLTKSEKKQQKEWVKWGMENPPRIDLKTLNKISKLLLTRKIK